MKQQLSEANERSLRQLSRAIHLSKGQFSLILASCESRRLRRQLTKQLQADSPEPISVLTLHPAAKTLLTTLKTNLKNREPSALMVFGLESVIDVERLLAASNLGREELRRHFPFPVVLWVNEQLRQQLRRISPDLRNWASTPIQFEVEKQSPTLFEVTSNPPLVVEVFRSHYDTDFDDSASEVVLLEPYQMAEMPTIVEALQDRKSVIVNFTQMGVQEMQRSVDFLSGCICALDGYQQKIGQDLFLFTPSCVKVSLKVSQQYQVTA